MDFARIDPRRDADAGAAYHVSYEGTPLYFNDDPIEIDVQGLESEVGKRAAAKMIKEADKRNGKKRNAKSLSVDEILKLTDEDELARAKFYAALTTGWRNVVYLEDDQMDDPDAKPEPLPFSEANAFKLYSTRPWVMEGLDDFLGDKSNFMRKVVIG